MFNRAQREIGVPKRRSWKKRLVLLALLGLGGRLAQDAVLSQFPAAQAAMTMSQKFSKKLSTFAVNEIRAHMATADAANSENSDVAENQDFIAAGIDRFMARVRRNGLGGQQEEIALSPDTQRAFHVDARGNPADAPVRRDLIAEQILLTADK